MGLRPTTVYAVACDNCPKTASYYHYDSDEYYELRLDQPELSANLRREITEQDWLVSSRILCPDCARTATDTAIERMETELTHEPLFDMQQHSTQPGATS